jgi:ABC-type multidrug transport system fused ATPase/permease subunit
MEGLERLMQGRTVITIAHRLGTIQDCDKIVVLKDGIVAEEGAHAQLMQRGGLYAELHRIQFESPAPEAHAAT